MAAGLTGARCPLCSCATGSHTGGRRRNLLGGTVKSETLGPSPVPGRRRKLLLAAVRELRQLRGPRGSQEPNLTRRRPGGLSPQGEAALLSAAAPHAAFTVGKSDAHAARTAVFTLLEHKVSSSHSSWTFPGHLFQIVLRETTNPLRPRRTSSPEMPSGDAVVFQLPQ